MSQSSDPPQTALPRLHFRVPPEPSHLLRARERMRDYLRRYCNEGPVIDQTVLCVEEACTNAIRHSGTAADIEIDLHFTKARLVATVRDRGRGFDVASFNRQRTPVPLQDHGRGLFIIAKLMDSLELRLDGGLEVRMSRRAAARYDRTSLESDLDAPRADRLGHGEARTRALLEEIEEAFVALDWEYRYVFANGHACRLLGKSYDEMLGHTPFELFAELRDSDLESGFRAAMELGTPTVMEWRSPLLGGWVETRIYPTTGGVTAYFHDIADRKSKEEERERLLVEQQRHAWLSEALNAINSAVSSHLDTGDVLDEVLRLAGEAFGCDAGSVALRDSDGWRLTHLWNMPVELQGRRFGGEDLRHGELALAEQRPILIADYRNDPLGNASVAEKYRIAASLAVPLIVDGEGFGCLFFTYYDSPHDYSDMEVDFARKVGAVVSQALQNARLFGSRQEARGETQRELETTRLLLEAVGLPAELLSPDDVFDRLGRVIRQASGHARVTVSLWDQQEGRLCVASSLGEPPRPTGLLVTLDELPEPAKRAIYERTTTLVDYDEMEPGRRGAGDYAACHLELVVPLFLGDRLVGLLTIEDCDKRREFNAREIALIEGIAAQATVTIENARLFEAEVEAQRRAEQELQTIEELATGLQSQADALAERADLADALNAINSVIHSTLDFDEIMARALAEGVAALGANAGAIELWQGESWVMAYQHGCSADDVGLRLSVAQAPVASRARATAQPVVVADLATEPALNVGFPRLRGLRAVLAVPLIVREVVIGCLLFHGLRPRSYSGSEVDFALKLAVTASLAIDNARVHAERAESMRLSEALNAIDVAISSAPGVDAIVQVLAGEGLRAIGCEGAVAVLAEGDEFVTRVAVGVAEPLLGQRFARDESPIGELVLTHEPFVSSDVRHDPRLASGFAERFGLRSLLFVPLVAREEMLGVLAFANLHSAMTFADDQVLFAAALATVGALAIDNANAYDVEHRTAETLRRLLAFPVPELAGLDIGAAHRAAAAAEQVGGDFFDVFAIDGRTVALFIADVSGKGVRAAGFTETIRSAVRTMAYIDASPGVVLGHVNESLIRQAADGLFATAALYVIDITTGEVRYSSAGHPPAVVCGDGCIPLSTAPGVPLGTFAAAYCEQSIHLAAGEVLLAFTDGITEARRDGELFGEVRVLGHLTEVASRKPQDLVDGLMTAATQFAGGELSDDAAIIAVSLAPPLP